MSIWRTARVKDLATLVNGHPFDSSSFSTDGAIPLVRIRDLLAAKFETFVQPSDVPADAVIRDGDIVIGMDGDFNVRLWDRGFAALNQRLCLLRANAFADPRFLAYALPERLRAINDLTYATTVKHLSSSQVRAIRLQVPVVDEQHAIADYLDRETTKIDTLIQEQQRLIGLLRERARASVDHVVWEGLKAAARVSSAVEPAPDTPAHWRQLRNKELWVERTEVSATGDEELLTISHISGISPRSQKRVHMTEAESHVGYRIVRKNDLVINTMWAWMGALGVSNYDGIASPAYGVYHLKPGVAADPRFLHYMYRSRPYVVEMTRHSRGVWSSRLRLYPEAFLALRVSLPPLDEQIEIAAHLDRESARIEALLTEAERFIALSKERRSALITSAVTGQINVREAA